MKMIRLLTLLTILSILLTGCTGERATKDAMKNAEALMEERPDSALTILKSMPQEKLITKELKARYSLLYAMALDKNYIDTTNLDVISPAIEYYSRYGSPIEKMKTYFYQGCIYANRRENDRAMYCWQLSLDDSLNVDDNHYKSLINSAISVIYSRNRNYEQELYYTREALKYGRMAGDSVGIWAITGHLAACYGNMQMYEDADRVYDEFFSMHIYDTLKYARRRLNYAKDLIRRETKRPAQSIEIIEDVAKTFPKAMTVEAYCIYAYALQISGNSDAASSIIQQLEAMNGSTDIIRVWRYRICREQGQYKQAIEDLEHSIMVQDSVILASIQQSLLRTQRDYLNAKTELLKKENKIVRQKAYIISFILIGGLVILILSLLLMSGKIKQIKEDRRLSEEKYLKIYDEALDEIERLKETLEDNKLTPVVQQRISERLNLLNTFIVSNMTPNYSKSALEQLKQLMDDKDYFIESTRLSFLVEHPKFISYLQQYGLTDNEIGYCCLYAMGLKGKDISSYLGKGHYKQSSAIRKKLGLNEHDTNLDIYIRDLISKESSL